MKKRLDKGSGFGDNVFMMNQTHNTIKVIGNKAILRDNGNVQVGDALVSGGEIVEIIRRSRQQGMDLVSIRWATKQITATEKAAINNKNNDCWEEHLRIADRRQSTGDWS